ncbi:MAG: hypothetical protein CMO29_02185 [Tistrella sp.]|nr:hypothetical protein [Tistrella sp.]|tara:strand:- start:7028 stop:7528 length:501 start_codon:yes stop_codon:yes gene_type:complete
MRRATFLKAEADFTLEDVTYRLVLDNLAWLAIEEILDTSLLDFMGRLKATIEAGKNPRIGDLAAVLTAALDRHHPEIDLDQAADMMLTGDTQLKAALITVINGSLPGSADKADGEDALGNGQSPAPTGGTGKPSSQTGAAPGSRSRPSGKARPALPRSRSGAKAKS